MASMNQAKKNLEINTNSVIFKQLKRIPNNNQSMITLDPQFITNKKGEKIAVVLPIGDFKAIIEELEELEEIKLYDEAQNSNEVSIPIDEAFKMIEAKRKTE